jgi:hypothetical protein
VLERCVGVPVPEGFVSISLQRRSGVAAAILRPFHSLVVVRSAVGRIDAVVLIRDGDPGLKWLRRILHSACAEHLIR